MSDNHPSSAPTNAASNTQFDGYLRVDPVTGNLQSAQPAKSDKPQIQKPTAPNPAPPELIPDERDAYAVCLSPDVCKSPKVPIPYMSWGKADDKLNYSPDVRANGKVIKRQDSKFSCCYGDEPGVGKGVKSGTVGDVVEPVTSSTIVRANGIPVQRYTDRCTLNKGNCPGEYIYVKSTDTHKAPDGADAQNRAWYDKTWDGFYDNSDEAQLAGGAIDKGKQYWNDPSQIGSDLQSAWNARPSVDDVVDFGKNVGSGIANTADYVWNNPGQSTQNVANWTGDALKGLWTGVTDAYEKGGVAQAGGHLAATALGLANPFKKAKAAGEAAEALEDVAKAERRLKEAEEAFHSPKNTRSGDGESTEDIGGRITRRFQVECFEVPEKLKSKAAEYKRQLNEQMDYINSKMTADDMAYAHWVLDRAGGTAALRQPYAQIRQRNQYKQYLRQQGKSEADIAKALEGQAATHFLDMVAGGNPKIFSSDVRGNPILGDSDVNSHIGNQWTQKGRAASLRTEAEHMRRSGKASEFMRVELKLC